MIEAPIQITAYGDGWHNIPYIRADIAAAQLAERDARIAELEAGQAWVSVDERLPAPFVMSLFVNANSGNEPRCGYVNRGDKWKNPDGTAVQRGPTHWMPLPPPPPVTDVTL
jgi:hypothetical protein